VAKLLLLLTRNKGFKRSSLRHPASEAREETKDAVVLAAQVPITMIIKPDEVQTDVKVEYGSDPKFEPLTSRQRGSS